MIGFMILAILRSLVAQSPTQGGQQTAPILAPAAFKEQLLCEFPQVEKIRGVSPDGLRFSWRAKQNNKWVMVVDGKPGSAYDDVPNWVNLQSFSPESKHFVYGAKHGNSWQAILDGEEYGTRYQHKIFGLRFSPDSRHFAYRTLKCKGPKQCMILDGEELGDYDLVGKPVFSPDGRRFAYPAARGSLVGVIVDGHAGGVFDSVALGPVFSPDSKHVAYIATSNKTFVQIVDGDSVEVRAKTDERTPPGEPETIQAKGGYELIFSPDSRRVAYVIRLAKPLQGCLILDDAQYGPVLEGIDFPMFSPSSRFLAYIVHRGEKVSMVINDKEGKGYDVVWPGNLAFSPDEKQAKYTARDGNSVFRVTQAVD